MAVLCQEDGWRSKKILQDYLYTMVRPCRRRKKQRNHTMIIWYMKNSGRKACSKTTPENTKNPRVSWCRLGWLRYQGWTRICCKTAARITKNPRVYWYKRRRWRPSEKNSRAIAQRTVPISEKDPCRQWHPSDILHLHSPIWCKGRQAMQSEGIRWNR